MDKKRGQVTLFIIIAIIIVAIAAFVFLIYPKIKVGVGEEERNPPQFIQACVEEDIKDAIQKVSTQGGSIDPEFYSLYKNNKVEYLCYTNEDYRPCVVQQPMLKSHIEKEIEDDIKDQVDNCFVSLKESFEKRGYNVNLKKGPINVQLLPNKIVSTFNYTAILSKTNTEEYESFSVVLDNNLYELVAIASNIIEWETTYGEAEPTMYMSSYPNLKVERKDKSDSSRIYILTDLETGDMFQFASRSQVWPAGYS